MADDIIRKCTFIDIMLFIFGILVLFVVGTDVIWFFIGICGFILIKAYIRNLGIFERYVGPQNGTIGMDAESDWDDDDNLVIGLYD